ncbi:hypothetical protein HNY73_020231 [Argiope bruennichi]|uniref:Uncharacterized protein n=1 Tax=Argiope bruennichi TaxID=94029 RepID=A0A8T0E776_ARGBR|nr:hypothetical protein HNY73_020231 [Argiope bruennichi]
MMDNGALIGNGAEALKCYNILEENICLLKQTLSKPLFAILLTSSINLYYALDFCLKEDELVFYSIAFLIDASVGILAILSIIIYSSKIPETIKKIKKTAGCLIERQQISVLNKGMDVSFLYRLEKKEVIFLSAGGMVDLKMSLLLSIIGALFTYGLLLLNLEN